MTVITAILAVTNETAEKNEKMKKKSWTLITQKVHVQIRRLIVLNVGIGPGF